MTAVHAYFEISQAATGSDTRKTDLFEYVSPCYSAVQHSIVEDLILCMRIENRTFYTWLCYLMQV